MVMLMMLIISFTIYCSAVRELFEYLPLSNKDFIAQVMMMTNFRDEYDDEDEDEDDGILMMMMMMMRYHIMTMMVKMIMIIMMTLRLHLEVTRR